MKNLLIVLVLGLSLTFIGCASQEEDEITTEDTSDSAVADSDESESVDSNANLDVEEESNEVTFVTGSEDSIEVNGQVLQIGMNVTDDIITAVGEPLDTMEAPSCHYDGNDTIYTYEEFALYTYLDGENNTLYLIELNGSSIQTANGAYVGMSTEEVIACCGSDYESVGMMMEYIYDNVTIDYSTDETGCISMIEIY